MKLGICRLPDGVSWSYLYGVALLAGIGFTMSLFVGTLAFSDPEHAKAVRLGVLMGSFFSAVLGYMMLRWLWARDQRALAAGGVAPGPGA